MLHSSSVQIRKKCSVSQMIIYISNSMHKQSSKYISSVNGKFMSDSLGVADDQIWYNCFDCENSSVDRHRDHMNYFDGNAALHLKYIRGENNVVDDR